MYRAPSANATRFATTVTLRCVDHFRVQCGAHDSPTSRIEETFFTEESTFNHLSDLENPESLDGDWVTGASDLANSGRKRSDDREMLKSNPNLSKCARDVHPNIADRPVINTARYWQEAISFRTAAII
jgi:hypothetical protein